MPDAVEVSGCSLWKDRLELLIKHLYLWSVGFLIVKALHIIFVVTWFAALFYIVRLFIYSTEAHSQPQGEVRDALLAQFAIMQRRLWFGIGWPSAILTVLFGATLVSYYLFVFAVPIPLWLWTKFALVIPLCGYHLACHLIYRQERLNQFRFSSLQLRVWNELATLFLFAIVFVVELRENLSLSTLVVSIVIIAAILLVAVVGLAKRKAKQNSI